MSNVNFLIFMYSYHQNYGYKSIYVSKQMLIFRYIMKMCGGNEESTFFPYFGDSLIELQIEIDLKH